MPYCTVDDIVGRIGEKTVTLLTNDGTPAAAVMDLDNAARAIAEAETVIDGYLSGRYALPLSPVPALVRKIATDLAVYNLYARRPAVDPPKSVQAGYDGALSLLKGLQKGDVNLPEAQLLTASPGPDATGGSGGRTNKTAADRIFGRETMDRY